MKLLYTITTRDDKTQEYECIDTHSFQDAFVTIYLPDFRRKLIRTETILSIESRFVP